MKKIALIIICLGVNLGFAQQTPAPKQAQSILLVGATAHIGNGDVIENSAIGFTEGKIVEVSTADLVKGNYDLKIDLKGKEVYPGFIAANSTVGMVEIDAIRPTNDLNEIGNFLPHIRTAIAYNAESKVVESLRPNGILTAQIVPRRGRIAGSSTVVQLDAWNWEDAALKTDEGLHLNWPRTYTYGRRAKGQDPIIFDEKNYSKQTREIEAFFTAAKSYNNGDAALKNLPYEAMSGVFLGTQKLYLHAKEKRQIIDGIHFLKKHGIQDIVLVGGDEAHLITDFLNEENIPVILSRPHRLPNTEDQDVKLPFKLAAKLVNAGILVTVDVSGRMERMNTRNLPFYAGSFAAYGVPKEKAVEMITLNAAKILGVENQLGSLEVGKDATLFVSEGDALDMRTNQLSRAYIQGREINLATHQTELWNRYMEKYSRK